jgi:MORN repeat
MRIPGAIAAGAILVFSCAAAAQPDDAIPAPGWITASNQPCKIWNPEPQPHESVTWSGGCADGLASGEGVLKWTEDGKPDVEFDGRYANGKRNGHGVLITPDGMRMEGVWVNDKLLSGDQDAI